MDTEPPAVDGRELAARALLAGAGCTQEGVAVLLNTSRRSMGRLLAADVTAAIHDVDARTTARTCLEGADSTTEERDAAEAWLLQAERDERPAERVRPETEHARTRPASGHAPGAGSSSAKPPAKQPAAKPQSCAGAPPRASLAQLEALTREQQRIERRSLILPCALTPLDPVPLREALADLVTEIAESARVIGMLLRPVG